MAMYIVYEAPLQMLADTPTRYKQNQECTTFIAAVPTVWDETRPLAGEMGEYVAIARRSGNRWFVATMNNWSPRTLTLKLDFLTAPAAPYSLAKKSPSPSPPAAVGLQWWNKKPPKPSKGGLM